MVPSSHIIPTSETSSNEIYRNLARFRVIAGRLLCHSTGKGRTRWKAARMNFDRGEYVALGVLWSPTGPKRRRFMPKLLLPGGRRIGGARRRGKHSAAPFMAAPFMTLALDLAWVR